MDYLADCPDLPLRDSLLNRIVRVESAGNPYAVSINYNTDNLAVRQPKTLDEALLTAQALREKGYTLSLGLMQINEMHKPRFSVTDRALFDPCRSLAIGATIFQENSDAAANAGFIGKGALIAALSAYNTGFLRSTIGAAYARRVLGTDVVTVPIQTRNVALVNAFENGPQHQRWRQASAAAWRSPPTYWRGRQRVPAP